MALLHGKAPPPPRPWEDAPEVEYRLHKNRINMARAYDSTIVTMKRLILRESANESEGTQFVTHEDSLDTADGKLHIHKIPQLPISKNKYFIVVMYPPEDLDIDDTPMDGDKPVKFLFSLYNLYLTGFSYDDIWRIFNDAMVVGICQESRDKYVKELASPGDYKTITQDYLKLDIGFDGQCDTYNKIVGTESEKTTQDQLIRVLCRTIITLPESARFAFLAQLHLINFHLGNFDAVLDKEVLQKEEYKNFSLHLTKWGTYSTMSKNGKSFFKATAIPTSGIQSFNCLLNFIAVATNKKYDDDKNQLKSEVVKSQNTEDDHTDDKGGKKGLDNNNEDPKENKKTVQDNVKTWFYQAPVMPYVSHRRQNLNLMVEAKFMKLQNHSKVLLRKQWLYGIVDDFVTKQLPHNVTWGLSLLYALEHKGDRALTSTQGELAHALRFLASVVSQSFVAFGGILELHKKFLELSGGISRIFELEEILHVAQRDTPLPSSAISTASEEIISFDEVDIVTPSQKLLASKLSCSVVQGKSLLLTGPNGTGKSSVFRVLKDLWPAFSGRVTKPSEGMFHVPQSPYTSLGTLRDQVIYPLSREEAEMKILSLYKAGNRSNARELLDDHLKTVLVNVRLVYLLEREGWDSTPNWEDVLSLGEQQRLGMARLFFHHPKFGILDECTNATSVDVEEHLYRLATNMGITVITSSQRPALIPFHSVELKLIDGEGNWELCEIQH